MPDTPAEYGSLPFGQAVEFFRQKVRVPTAKWADMLHGAHTRAFTVAGATKDALLVDFQQAIDKAIAEGTTLEEFRKDFDKIVTTHGWDYNGARGWRTRVIYDTNLRTAYAAGRFAQMTDPDVQRYRPFWRYRHDDGVKHPRPEHLAWDGTVLDADDAWWKEHYPPNGWGCRCYVEPLTRRELRALGKDGPDTAPKTTYQEKTLNTSAGPLTIEVPKGVDPGWGYNVGEAAYGRKLTDEAMAAWRQQGAAAWERMTPGDWRSAGRPERIPRDTTRAKPTSPFPDREAASAALQRAIGAPEAAIVDPTGDALLVDAASVADHIDLARSGYIAVLPEVIVHPFEIWLAFERHKGSGQVVLRKRYIKALDQTRYPGLLLVAQASAGRMEAWTLVRVTDLAYLQRQRVGALIWGRT